MNREQKKTKHPNAFTFGFLAMAKKDIFVVLLYEFELSQKMIYRLRNMIYGVAV